MDLQAACKQCSAQSVQRPEQVRTIIDAGDLPAFELPQCDVAVEHGDRAGWPAPIPLESTCQISRTKKTARRMANKGCWTMVFGESLPFPNWIRRSNGKTRSNAGESAASLDATRNPHGPVRNCVVNLPGISTSSAPQNLRGRDETRTFLERLLYWSAPDHFSRTTHQGTKHVRPSLQSDFLVSSNHHARVSAMADQPSLGGRTARPPAERIHLQRSAVSGVSCFDN